MIDVYDIETNVTAVLFAISGAFIILFAVFLGNLIAAVGVIAWALVFRGFVVRTMRDREEFWAGFNG